MKILEAETKEYFGCQVTVSRTIDCDWIWFFDVRHNGILHQFRGLPNKCESKASALKRAWYRAKWLNDGTYNQRYV
jgi:hypothetical protein